MGFLSHSFFARIVSVKVVVIYQKVIYELN